MRTFLLASRYARALLDAVGESTAIEEASRSLNELSALFSQNAQLRHILGNTTLAMEGRKKIIEGLFEAQQTPESVRRLLRALLAGNRMMLLPELAVCFEHLVDERFNRVEATATTAVPLDPALEEKLASSMSQHTGKTIRMKNQVAPEILGGLIVNIRGRLFDFSLRSRLERLRARLLEEGAFDNGD